MAIRKIFLVSILFCGSCTRSITHPSNDIDIISFHRGYTIWEDYIESSIIPYSIDQVMNGLRAAQRGDELPIPEEEIVKLVRNFQEKEWTKNLQQNLIEAETYVKDISTSAVEVIPSKLYYVQTRQGKGERKISLNDEPFIVYKAMIPERGEEKEIFSTGDEAIQVSLTDMIPAFTEGVIGMSEGEKRTLFIHPDLTSGHYPMYPNKLIIIELEIVRLN